MTSPQDWCRLKFWGVRGSVPTPGPSTVRYGGNTSCVEVRADGELIVLDAGTGIRPLGLSLAREFAGKPLALTLLITHTHWDHIQGLPFFQPAYDVKNKVRILGYEGAKIGLASTLAGQMESPYFPIALEQMPGSILIEELREMDFHIGRVRVQAWVMNHPGIAVGYRLFTSGGSIAYLPDNEPFSHCHVERPPHVRDTNNLKLIDFIRDADVLVMDSQYDRDEYHSHIGWGHGCIDDVVKLALSADVKHLFLFHHDPNHDDERIDALLAHAREIARSHASEMKIDAAREGETVDLAKSFGKVDARETSD